MALLSKLKALIGLNGSGSDRGGTSVPVEREPAAESERAVKQPVSEVEDAATDADATATSPGDADAEPVESITGIGPAYAERLAAAGVETVGDLASADVDELDASTDIGRGRLEGWIERARDR